MGIVQSAQEYVLWLEEVKNYSPHTVRAYRADLQLFVDTVGVDAQIRDLCGQHVQEYVRVQRNALLSERTIARRLAVLQGWEKWLKRGAHPLSGLNIVEHKVTPKGSLPRVAAMEDIRRLLRRSRALSRAERASTQRPAPVSHTVTMLAASIMFAVGTRVAETASIRVPDLDLETGRLTIVGKGRRTRVVYITNRWLLGALNDYSGARASLHLNHSQLLVNRDGSPITPETIRRRIRVASLAAGGSSPLTPHMFRHAAATSLLEAGVDIRFVQQLLGHASVSTTQIYTHVTPTALRGVLEVADILGSLLER